MLITVPQIPINSRLSRHREKCPLAVGFSRKQIRSLLQEFCFPWTSDFQLPRGSRRIVVVKLWNFATTPVPPHSRISRIISVVDQKDWQSLTGDSSLQYVSFLLLHEGVRLDKNWKSRYIAYWARSTESSANQDLMTYIIECFRSENEKELLWCSFSVTLASKTALTIILRGVRFWSEVFRRHLINSLLS